MNNTMSIESALALDGRIFAMLTPAELELFKFYRSQGRKYGVVATIVSAADPAELAEAKTQAHQDEVMRRVNSTVSVVRTTTDVFAEAAALALEKYPPRLVTITQDISQLERLYPKGGDGKSSIARHPTQNVTDFLQDAHKALSDALERVLLDPTVAALPPMEQARLAAQLVIAESAARASGLPVHDAKRYFAGLTYVNDENLEADGHESGTNAPYYFGHSIITAFEAGAIWQGQQTCGSK